MCKTKYCYYSSTCCLEIIGDSCELITSATTEE